MKTYKTKVVPVEYGVEISEELLESLGWKEGDEIGIEVQKDSSISLSKIEYTEIEIELSDEDFVNLAKAAHKLDITFNQFVEKVIAAQVENLKQKNETFR